MNSKRVAEDMQKPKYLAFNLKDKTIWVMSAIPKRAVKSALAGTLRFMAYKLLSHSNSFKFNVALNMAAVTSGKSVALVAVAIYFSPATMVKEAAAPLYFLERK